MDTFLKPPAPKVPGDQTAGEVTNAKVGQTSLFGTFPTTGGQSLFGDKTIALTKEVAENNLVEPTESKPETKPSPFQSASLFKLNGEQ